MKTILVCAFLLHPHMGEGYNTTVVRVNKKDPQKCLNEATRYNAKVRRPDCRCEEKNKRLPTKAIIPPKEPK